MQREGSFDNTRWFCLDLALSVTILSKKLNLKFTVTCRAISCWYNFLLPVFFLLYYLSSFELGLLPEKGAWLGKNSRDYQQRGLWDTVKASCVSKEGWRARHTSSSMAIFCTKDQSHQVSLAGFLSSVLCCSLTCLRPSPCGSLLSLSLCLVPPPPSLTRSVSIFMLIKLGFVFHSLAS